jgi:hypothetical protein
VAALQPPLAEHREQIPHPCHRIQRQVHRPNTGFEPEIGFEDSHGINQDAAAHGHRRRLAHPRHVHAVLNGSRRVQRQPLLRLVGARHLGRADQQNLRAAVGQ